MKPVLIIVFILVLGCVLVLPNGVDPRVQRFGNMQFIFLAASGLIALFSVSWSIGALLLYTCYETLRGINITILSTIVALSVFFLFIVMTAPHWWAFKGLIYDALILIAGLNIVFQALQYFHVSFLIHPTNGQLVGLMSNVDETFALYMICLPAFFRKRRWQLLIPICIGGLILASPLVNSSQHYGVIEHISGRWAAWSFTIHDMGKALWFGQCFHLFQFYNAQNNNLFLEAHNEYVEIAWRFGIVGIALFLWTLYRTIRRGLQGIDRIPLWGLALACVSAVPFFTWHILPLALISVVWAAIIYSDKEVLLCA